MGRVKRGSIRRASRVEEYQLGMEELEDVDEEPNEAVGAAGSVKGVAGEGGEECVEDGADGEVGDEDWLSVRKTSASLAAGGLGTGLMQYGLLSSRSLSLVSPGRRRGSCSPMVEKRA